MIGRRVYLVFLAALLLSATQILPAQTSTFNYQGRLTEGGNPANGAFQMQFRLFDALAAGNQIGSTLNDVPVTVSQGVFTVKLNFGANALSGANRWLEIAVRHTSSEFYTVLSPREQIASSPYAVRTLSAATADNALNLGGIPANQYVTTSTVGSSFIRNGLATQTANFNISGDGFMGGNLALGTFNGQARLELAGTGWGAVQKITDSPSGNSLVLQAGTGNTMKVTGYNYNTNTAVPLFLSVDGGNTLINSGGGNVGIGTSSPTARLTIVGDGLNGYSLGVSGNVGVGGNITQAASGSGLVKAMLSINTLGTIRSCYNGLTGATIAGGTSNTGCNFTVNHFTTGGYGINLGFPTVGRFVSVTTRSTPEFPTAGSINSSPSSTSIDVWIMKLDDGSVRDGIFDVIVF